MGRAREIAVFGMAFAAALLYYATGVEPSRVECSEVAVRDGRLAHVLGGHRVAFLSDLHFGLGANEAPEAALRILEKVRPDLIVLAGDFVDWGGGHEAYQRALHFLSRLHAPLGVYAVLGDADRSSFRDSCLFCHEPGSGSPTRRHQVSFLKDSMVTIELPRGRLRIVGLDPDFPESAAPRLGALLAGDTPTILLSHSSRVYRQVDPALTVLTLSGDTHGGQIRLPRWLWRLIRAKPDPDHMQGRFTDSNKSLFVTRGVGTSHLRFRLGSPPEVVLFRFHSEKR